MCPLGMSRCDWCMKHQELTQYPQKSMEIHNPPSWGIVVRWLFSMQRTAGLDEMPIKTAAARDLEGAAN